MGKTIQVILVNDVPSLGKSSEVKTVSPGYARNLLFPKNLAILATPKAIAQANVRLERRVKEEEERRDKMKETLARLEYLTVTMSATASPDGTLFAGIHAAQIVEKLHEQGMSDVSESMISLSTPIKKVGDHPFELVFDPTTHVKGTVHVESKTSTP